MPCCNLCLAPLNNVEVFFFLHMMDEWLQTVMESGLKPTRVSDITYSSYD